MQNNSNNLIALIRGGVLYKDYLHQNKIAETYLKKALNLANRQATVNAHKIVDDEIIVVYILSAFQRKNAAPAYLEKISPYYQDAKSSDKINQYKKLIKDEKPLNGPNRTLFNTYYTN